MMFYKKIMCFLLPLVVVLTSCTESSFQEERVAKSIQAEYVDATCAEALQEPGIYAGKLFGTEREDYQALRDCYEHLYCGGKNFYDIGIISERTIANYANMHWCDTSICDGLLAVCRFE